MILVVDNYDSFTWNLVHALGALGATVEVHRNDAITVDALAKKPTLQEKLVTELADLLMKKLKPRGALVIVEGRHLCLEMIGAKKPGAKTITSAVRGIFEKNQATRAEALSLIKG